MFDQASLPCGIWRPAMFEITTTPPNGLGSSMSGCCGVDGIINWKMKGGGRWVHVCIMIKGLGLNQWRQSRDRALVADLLWRAGAAGILPPFICWLFELEWWWLKAKSSAGFIQKCGPGGFVPYVEELLPYWNLAVPADRTLLNGTAGAMMPRTPPHEKSPENGMKNAEYYKRQKNHR